MTPPVPSTTFCKKRWCTALYKLATGKMPVKLRKGVCELEKWEGNGKKGDISNGDEKTILSTAKPQF